MRRSLSEQIACVERELGYRRRIYPKLIKSGRMTPTKVAAEIDTMEAVAETLRALPDPEKLI